MEIDLMITTCIEVESNATCQDVLDKAGITDLTGKYLLIRNPHEKHDRKATMDTVLKAQDDLYIRDWPISSNGTCFD